MKRAKDWMPGLLLTAPSLIALAVFVYGFIGWNFRISLTDWKALSPDFNFVGLKNYRDLLIDERFKIDIRNSLIFTVVFMVACLLLGLILAILLDQKMKFESLFRSVYLLPMAISFIVTGVVWRWLMNPATGDRISGINLLFTKAGLDSLVNQWHLTPNWGMAGIALPAVWQMAGYTMALFLAGIRSIPEEIREAARVDGASEWRIYRHVILPQLRPIALSAIVILGHISLKVFDLIIAIAGKQLALDVPAIYMWQTSFDAYNFGKGATLATYILFSVAILIIPYLLFTMRQERRS
jgi:glucose/mannose transport system permease protein